MVRVSKSLEGVPMETIVLRWQTFVVLGVVLAALGIFAMGAASLATLASVLVFGWALIVGGVLQLVHAISHRPWGGRVLDVLTGVLFLVVGALAVWRPVESAISLTLVIAVALMIRGVFAIVAATADRYPQWGWTVAYGVVSVILSVIIAAQWPAISMWVIGFLVGIELLADGIAVAMTGLAARSARREGRPYGRRPPEPLPPTERRPAERPLPGEHLPAT
jgi:uncharacterized membrane protein HdeD (DUF308 family)